MTNPYDEIAAGLPGPEDRERERQVQASQVLVTQGQGLTGRLTKISPAPPDWSEITRDLPATQELLADPERAAAVQGDVEQLSALERAFGGASEMAWESKRAWQRGRASARLAEIGYLQSIGAATADQVAEADRLEAQMQALAPRPLGFVPGIPAAVAESLPFMGRAAAGAGRETSVGAAAGLAAGATGGAVAGGVGAIPGAAAGLAGGATMGFKLGMAVEAGKLEKGLAYREYMRIPGVTHDAAALASTFVGIANGALEVAPLDAVLHVPAIKSLLAGAGTRDVFKRVLRSTTGRAAVARAATRLAGSFTLEGLTEAAQELSTILGGQAAAGGLAGLDLGEVDWGRVVEAGVQGGQGGLGMGAPGVASGLQVDLAEVARVRARAAFWTRLGEAAAASKTLEDAPDVAHEYLRAVAEQHGGAVEGVTAPAEALEQLFQKADMRLDQVAQRMPAVARQLEEAAANPGVEVAIPTAELALVARLPGYEQLVLDLRVGDELTLREAEKVEKEAKELAATEAKAEGTKIEATPEQRVAGDVAAKLEAAGQDADVARTSAALWASFARVMAGRTGAKDAWSFYGKLGLQVEHEDIAAIPVEPGLEVAAQGQPKAGAQPRGYVTFPKSREWFQVTLTGSANLSTFLHESGHVFLEVLRASAEKDAGLAADLKTVQDWLGVPLMGAWTADQLERFARGFEAYLREGKAPSSQLAEVFAAVKSWLLLVYRSLRGLDVELTDDVRGVMDRLLATEAEIAAARQAAGLAPAFKSAEEAGLSKEAFAAYEERWHKAKAAARAEVESRAIAALARTVGEERAAVRAEVEQLAREQEAFNLREFLRTGKRLDGAEVDEAIAGAKLDSSALEGLADKRELRRLQFFVGEGGLDPDTLAPYFGFRDGHELVRALVETPRREAWIRAEVEARMAEKYPDSKLSELSRMSVEAVQEQEGFVRALRDELAAVGRKVGAPPARSAVEVLRRAAKERAAGMVELELRPDKYRRAEAADAREFLEHLAAKRFAEAHDAKRRQLWNHFLAAETAKAKAEAERIRTYLHGFEDIGARRRLGKAGPRYLEAMDALLDGIELRRTSIRAVQRRQSLAAHVAALEAEGDVVAPALKDLAELKSYREMTLDELRGVEAAAANLDAMARLKGKLLLRKERRDLLRTAQGLAEHIRANVGASKGPTPGDKPPGERVRSWFRGMDASMKKLEFLVRELDGGQTAGPAHELIFQPLVDAQNARYDLLDKVQGALMEPFAKLSRERRARYRQKVGFLYSPKFGKMVRLSRRNVLAVLLNLGNAGNRERLLKGYGWTEAEVVARLGQLLDAEDVALVEHVWKTVDSLWPAIRDLHERHAGIAPKRVEATPFSLVLADGTTAKLSGGYYPIVKALDLSDKGRALAELEEAQQLWTANFFAPVVEHGFTQSRGNDMSPLELDLSVATHHVNKVVHYLTHYEAIRGVDRLLQVPLLRDAIREGVGGEYLAEFRPWLEAIAADGVVQDPIAIWSRTLRYLRFGSTVVMLFGKIPQGLKQSLGLFTSAKEVKRRHLVAGLRKFLRDGWSEVLPASGEFRHIDKQLDRDARELFDSLQGRFSDLGRARAKVIEWGAMPIMLVQKSVNAVTWYAAREQAVEEGHADPAAYADSIVRMTQTGGGVKDLAAIQRSGEFFKMLTVMFSYRSVLYNLLAERTGKTSWAKAREVFGRVWWLILMPVVAEQLLANGIADDEEPEDVAKRVLLEAALLPASTIPAAGDIADTLLAGRKMDAAPWLVTLGRGLDAAKDVVEGDATAADARALAAMVGTVLHVPTAGLWNVGEYLVRLAQHDLEEPVSDLLFRNPSKWE